MLQFPNTLVSCVYWCTAGEESGKPPSSPFDISKFEVFSSKDSPVTTIPPDADKVNMYSRHSRDNSQTEIQLEWQQQVPSESRVPRSISPILAQQAGLKQLQVKATDEPNYAEPDTIHDQTTGDDSTGANDSTTYLHHSTPKSAKSDENAKEEGNDSGTVSPRNSAKLIIDELVSDHANLAQPVAAKDEDINVDDRKDILEGSSDRALEFENLVVTDESSSEPPTSSTVSLLDDDDSRCVQVHV